MQFWNKNGSIRDLKWKKILYNVILVYFGREVIDFVIPSKLLPY